MIKCSKFKNKTLKNQFIKGQFTSQALFAIFMLVLFIWILVYGYNAVIGASQDLSDRELEDLRISIEQRTSICSEQSQRGRLETLSISIPQITQLCYVHDFNFIDSDLANLLNNSGVVENSIILLNGPINYEYLQITSENITLTNEFMIYDIIPLQSGAVLASSGNRCIIQEGRSIDFRFQC
ncbi:MAG: hypothetical protein LAT82_01955 [Nanoarchaeota archaeon]|nr:hypothetical protein [Nanoarchaeota archaeon]